MSHKEIPNESPKRKSSSTPALSFSRK